MRTEWEGNSDRLNTRIHSFFYTVVIFFNQFSPFFQDFADADGDGVVTNWEFYLSLDPNDIEGNDYVFDNFDWPHC